MAPQIIRHLDITGQKFGFLTAVKRAGTKIIATSDGNKQKAIWECLCDCGNRVTVVGSRLRSGRTKSCGHCEVSGLIKIDGMMFGSLLEASYYLSLKSKGVVFEHDRCYPGSQMRFDFYLPAESKYIEVTSYDEKVKWWGQYLAKIAKKKAYVENVLGEVFEFINEYPSAVQRRAVMDVASFETRRARPPITKLRKEDFWKSADWGLSDEEISKETSYSVSGVCHKRHLFAPDGKRAWDILIARRFAGADWSKSNGAIARDMDVSVHSVRKARRRLGISNCRNDGWSSLDAETASKIRAEKWSTTDWSKSNYAIAKERNCSEAAVCNARQKLGIVNSRTFKAKEQAEAAKERWSKTDWSQTDATLARQWGLNESTISSGRKRFGTPRALALAVKNSTPEASMDEKN